MNVEKTILGKAMTPVRKPVPFSCSKAKTIIQTYESLLFFRDSRLEAQNYVREVLPTLWLIDNCEEVSMKLYNSLKANQYLEYSLGTQLLFLCTIKS